MSGVTGHRWLLFELCVNMAAGLSEVKCWLLRRVKCWLKPPRRGIQKLGQRLNGAQAKGMRRPEMWGGLPWNDME